MLAALKDGSVSEVKRATIPPTIAPNKPKKPPKPLKPGAPAKGKWFVGAWKNDKSPNTYMWLDADGSCYFCTKFNIDKKKAPMAGKWSLDDSQVHLNYDNKTKVHFSSIKATEKLATTMTEFMGKKMKNEVEMNYVKTASPPQWVKELIKSK